jgi:hypothetical protein
VIVAPIAMQLIDGLLQTMEDKSERFENTGNLIFIIRIVLNGQEVP